MFGVIIVFFLYLLSWLYLCSKCRKEALLAIPLRRYTLLCAFFMLLGLLGLQQGDYVHYIDILRQIDSITSLYTHYSGYISHMEPQYVWLAKMCQGAYLPWRFFVFSLQYLVLFYFVRKLNYNTYLMYLLILILCMHDFVYQRASWGIILFVCSLAYAIQTRKYYFLLLCPFCFFAHKSLIVLYLCSPVVFLRCTKRNLLLMAGVFLAMIAVVSFVFANSADLANEFQQGEVGQEALSQMSHSGSYSIMDWLMGSSIGNFLGTTPSRLVIIYTVFKLAYETSKKQLELPRTIEAMLLLCLTIILLALAFAFSGRAHSVYVNRVLCMASLPLTFVVHHFYEHHLLGKKYCVVSFSIVSFCFLYLFLLEIFYSAVL